MKQLPLISVIIPFYNTPEHFFKKCIESLECQTYPNLEILVVDDGSDPKKSKCLNEYCHKKYKNLTIIHKEKNEGLFAARITGFEHSHGSFIGFIDSDDSVSMDYIRTLYRQIEKYDADICLSDWVYELGKNGEKKFPVAEELRSLDINYSNEEIVEKFLKDHGYNFSWQFIHSKLITRSLFEKCLPDFKKFNELSKPLIMCEDVAFTSALYLNAKRVVNAHHAYYYYRQHDMQSTNIFSKKKFTKSLNDIVKVFDIFFKQQLETKGLYEQYKDDFEKRKINLYNTYYSISKSIGCEDDFFKITGLKSFKSIKDVNMTKSYFVNFNENLDEFENIIKNILDPATKVVSFDLFDTLLLRKTYFPKDIFTLCENALKKELSTCQQTRFDEIRTNAEAQSRINKPDGETTLDEIYSYMVTNFGFDEDLAQKVKQKELEIEFDCLIQRQTGFSLYDIASINNKKVVYTSDMYLPKSFLLDVIEKNNYDRNNTLYLSNEYSKTKASGKLYKIVKETCKVKYSQIVHIGDNFESDFLNAKKLNINAFHLTKASDVFNHFILSDFNDFNSTSIDFFNSFYGFIGFRLILAQVVNKLFDYPFLIKQSTFQASMKQIGYFALGTHLFAFVSWLIKNSKNAKKIHFVARDGYLPMEAYKILTSNLNQENLPKANYLLMSRPFLLPLSIYNKKDLFTIVNQMDITNKNLKSIINYFPKECINCNILNQIKDKELNQKFKNCSNFYKSIPILASVINFDKLKDYQNKISVFLSNLINPNDYLVDIGYSGRGETILTTLLKYKVNGLYVHTNSDSTQKNQLMSNFENKCFYEYKPKVTGSIRELLFMKTDPSFLNYDTDNNFSPIMGNNDNNDHTSNVINTIQSNALQFVKDLTENYSKYYELLDMFQNESVSFPYEYYLHYSSQFDKSVFYNFEFEDAIGSGNFDLLSCWNNQCRYYNSQHMSNVANVSLARFVFEKYFPKNTKRRAFAGKVARKLIPAGSKRRRFVRKILFIK